MPIAASIRLMVLSFPMTSITSKMPGLTVPPVRATRTGWASFPSFMAFLGDEGS